MHLQRRLPMTRAGFFLLTVFTVPGAVAESAGDGIFEGLQQEMSSDEERATGVDSLSDTAGGIRKNIGRYI